MQVRPTSDRLRETLFNVLAPRIEAARFLDLCAGSGAVGIEALSRGASFATFVDRSRKMCGLIESNLDLCRIPEDQTEVVMNDAAEFLRRTRVRASGGLWDIIFYDPPYDTNYSFVLEAFSAEGASALLTETGLLVMEHHHKNNLKDTSGGIRRSRILKQGDSVLSFYER